MPRIISGHIAADGSIVSGSGDFTVHNDYEKVYKVTFTEPFTTYANVVATPFLSDEGSYVTTNFLESLNFIVRPSTLGFVVQVYDGTTAPGASFQFIAVGE